MGSFQFLPNQLVCKRTTSRTVGHRRKMRTHENLPIGCNTRDTLKDTQSGRYQNDAGVHPVGSMVHTHKSGHTSTKDAKQLVSCDRMNNRFAKF